MQSLAQVILNIAKYGSSTDANAKVSEKLKDTCNSDFPFKAELWSLKVFIKKINNSLIIYEYNIEYNIYGGPHVEK